MSRGTWTHPEPAGQKLDVHMAKLLLGAVAWFMIWAIFSGRAAQFPAEAMATLLLYIFGVALMLVAGAAMFKKAGSIGEFCGKVAVEILKYAWKGLVIVVTVTLGLVWGFLCWIGRGFKYLAVGKSRP